MANTIAVILLVFLLAEGAVFALAPGSVRRILRDAPTWLLALSGVVEVIVAVVLLSILARA